MTHPGRNLPRASRGFTLIEIMVVVVILGILAAVIVPKIMDRPDQARINAARASIAQIDSALKLYRLDNFSYPSTQQGIEALVSQPSGDPPAKNWKPYLDRMPKDPWGNPYQYLSPGVKGEIDIFSLGADNRPGGEAAAGDIGNWDLSG
ncbi:MAG: type II secretion system major pseudopilin GspG [Panacagrimonas sp.]